MTSSTVRFSSHAKEQFAKRVGSANLEGYFDLAALGFKKARFTSLKVGQENQDFWYLPNKKEPLVLVVGHGSAPTVITVLHEMTGKVRVIYTQEFGSV